MARPAARMVLVSMRMILPNWLMTISSRGVVDELDGVDLADALGDGHVLDALAAARLQAVFLDVGALAEAVLGDRRMR